MAKKVVRSIKPYWVYLICEGLKTEELGKNVPIDEDWDKTVLIYCSKDKKSFNRIPKENQGKYRPLMGTVVGEFQCNTITYVSTNTIYDNWDRLAGNLFEHEKCAVKNSCVPINELREYSNHKSIRAWRVTDLEVYDKPKSLNEFYKPTTLNESDFLYMLYDGSGDPERRSYASYLETCAMRRPPQSWYFVKAY